MRGRDPRVNKEGLDSSNGLVEYVRSPLRGETPCKNGQFYQKIDMVAANLPLNQDEPGPSRWSLADPDRAAAQVLADEYAALPTMPSIKIMELIDRCWRHYADGDRRQLAQALLGILAPIDQGGKVTREIRTLCERTVMQWKGRLRERKYQTA